MSEVSQKKTWERRLDDAKAKHRPKLRDWSRDEFATRRKNDFELLRLPETIIAPNNAFAVDKISCTAYSPEQFIEKYEKNYQPCIITDIPAAENWPAAQNWTFEHIENQLKNRLFKCGEDDDGYKIKVKLRYFCEYMRRNSDDSPLYIFDGSFDNDEESKSLLSDYRVPSYFRDDLFSLVGEKRRPPYRWFLMGPARSGSCVHTDPLGTSAWNTLLVGRKRWVLFLPGTKRNIVKGLDVIRKGEDDEAVNYFVDILPRIRRTYGHNTPIVEFIQYPGETVFVPGGWWHAVINLDDTVAVTQNFCSYSNFDKVWRFARRGRRKMSTKWLIELLKHHPVLGKRALELNQLDGFVMDYERQSNGKYTVVPGSRIDAKLREKERKRLKKDAKLRRKKNKKNLSKENHNENDEAGIDKFRELHHTVSIASNEAKLPERSDDSSSSNSSHSSTTSNSSSSNSGSHSSEENESNRTNDAACCNPRKETRKLHLDRENDEEKNVAGSSETVMDNIGNLSLSCTAIDKESTSSVWCGCFSKKASRDYYKVGDEGSSDWNRRLKKSDKHSKRYRETVDLELPDRGGRCSRYHAKKFKRDNSNQQ